MVYYNKDDLTNYSKGLGLNKVKAKNQPSYFSENDVKEVNEDMGEMESPMSDDGNGRRRHLKGMHTLDPESYNDEVDGRVKVDSWNLNYKGKKNKHKRKLDEKNI